MFSDLRLALRQLAKSPGFAAVAVLSLALGIGANTVIFSLVNEVLLKSLPVREPDRLVLFGWAAQRGFGPHSHSGWSTRDPKTGEQTSTSFSRRTYELFRAESGAPLTDVFAFAPLYRASVIFDGQAEVVTTGQVVSGNYHQALGVPMIAGRALTPEDDRPGAPPVVVLSAPYWQRRFGGDAAVIGKTMTINNVVAEIVGITIPRFPGTLQIGEVQDLTLPLSTYTLLAPDDTDSPQPWAWWLRIMGRLAPGASHEQARAAMAGVHRASIKDTFGESAIAEAKKQGDAPPEERVRLIASSGAQGLVEARRMYSQSLLILSSLVGLVLLVACANVANLLLARGAARQREIAVRLALGASRRRLLRQLLTESVLLGLLGGLAGLVFAWWGRGVLLAWQPLGRGSLSLDLALDWRVLGFTTAVAVLTGVLFGLAPAWRATRLDLSAEFAGGARTLGGARSRLAGGLMVVQVALSLVLLVGAALFTRTLVNLQQVDSGFNRSRLLLFSVDAMAAGRKRAELPVLYDRIAGRFRALPGVASLGYSQMPILSGGSWSSNVVVEGEPEKTGRSSSVVMNGVDPEFFSTYGMPILQGRAFTARDEADAPRVAIVSQAFVREYLDNKPALGRRFGSGRPQNAGDYEIVGVVRDARGIRLNEEPRPSAFFPYPQLRNARAAHFALRVTTDDPAALAQSLQNALREVDPALPLFNLRTQESQVAQMLTSERLFARLSSFFGLLALLLAGIGLYGLLSYNVLRRTGEIGLRMALGALPGRVLWMVISESLLLVSLGALLGLASAWGLSRLVANKLYGLSATDPATYVLVALVLLAVAALASLLPARRAARVDPMVALRTE